MRGFIYYFSVQNSKGTKSCIYRTLSIRIFNEKFQFSYIFTVNHKDKKIRFPGSVIDMKGLKKCLKLRVKLKLFRR